MSEKKEYKLSGMTCAACAMTVEMVVKDLDTVRGCHCQSGDRTSQFAS